MAQRQMLLATVLRPVLPDMAHRRPPLAMGQPPEPQATELKAQGEAVQRREAEPRDLLGEEQRRLGGVVLHRQE